MRLLYLLTQDLDSPSGLGRYLPLARELAALGHQVSIAALHPSFHTLSAKRLDLDGVRVSYVAPMHVIKEGSHKRYYSTPTLLRLALLAALRLGQAANAAGAEIIHIGKPHPMNSLAALIARRMSQRQTKPRLFLDCDDDEAASNRVSGAWQRRILDWFETRMPQQVERVTTNTLATRARLLQRGLPAERIFYLPNGVDRKRFSGVDPEPV